MAGFGICVGSHERIHFRTSRVTSMFFKFFLQAPWPATKQATGVIIVSNYRSFVANDTGRSICIKCP